MNSRVVELLQNLIQIPSVSGQEAEIQKYIFDSLVDLGFKPLLVDGNVILTIPGADRSKLLILNAHVDTVAAGDGSLWRASPHSGNIENDRIYGLGSSDEKACAAILLALAEKYCTEVPACDVMLTFVVNEETDGSGTIKFLEWFNQNSRSHYTAIAGIFGEPTDANKVYIAHRGGICIGVTTYGDSGHASQPQNIKTHSVKSMHEVGVRIEDLAIELANDYVHPVLGIPTIACLTTITAGQSTNKFPDACSATFDVRNTPGLTEEIVVEGFKRVLTGINCSINVLETRMICGFTDPNEQVVKVAVDVTRKNAVVATYSTDMSFFTGAGIPGIVYGPGTESCIHQPNEYCIISQLNRCLEEYSQFIEQF